MCAFRNANMDLFRDPVGPVLPCMTGQRCMARRRLLWVIFVSVPLNAVQIVTELLGCGAFGDFLLFLLALAAAFTAAVSGLLALIPVNRRVWLSIAIPC